MITFENDQQAQNRFKPSTGQTGDAIASQQAQQQANAKREAAEKQQSAQVEDSEKFTVSDDDWFKA